jgi:hypothetical protein
MSRYSLVVIKFMSVIIIVQLINPWIYEPRGKSAELPSDISSFSIPIFQSAENIVTRLDEITMSKSTLYDVSIFYPAKSVLLFYDYEMMKLGYRPFFHNVYRCDRTWRSYIDGTISGDPRVAQLVASWIDPNESRIAVLDLKYYWYEHKTCPIILEDNNKLKVVFHIMPYPLGRQGKSEIQGSAIEKGTPPDASEAAWDRDLEPQRRPSLPELNDWRADPAVQNRTHEASLPPWKLNAMPGKS